jgi:hypothetical protein
MRLRDEIESVLRAWNRYETERGATPAIDYDLYPISADVLVADSRLSVYYRLHELRRLTSTGETWLTSRLDADLAYLRALLGERPPLDEFVQATQACRPGGWPPEYVSQSGELARDRLTALGISWGANTDKELSEAEGLLDVESAPEAIRQAAVDLEGAVREATGATASYELDITTVDEAAYWSYWLDGAGQRSRLRLNLRHASFTKVRARQFALHEVLGHALQSANLAARCSETDVPWVRLLSVHAPHQVVLEGLAQALPLFVAVDDQALVARVRLDHYLQLVRAELHIALNDGATVDDCATHARSRVPFWTDETISDALTDRGANPLLRSYLWSYPAGLDWFIALSNAGATVIREVLHAAYREPLTAHDLARLWPAGPPIGGPGRSIRLRNTDFP